MYQSERGNLILRYKIVAIERLKVKLKEKVCFSQRSNSKIKVEISTFATLRRLKLNAFSELMDVLQF